MSDIQTVGVMVDMLHSLLVASIALRDGRRSQRDGITRTPDQVSKQADRASREAARIGKEITREVQAGSQDKEFASQDDIAKMFATACRRAADIATGD